MSTRRLRTIEFVLLIAGSVLLVFFGAAHLHRRIFSRAAIEQFKAREQQATPQSGGSPLKQREFRHDFSLWSKERVTAYEVSLAQHLDSPEAILQIPKVRLEVPVFHGTDDLTLNRGVGSITGMSRPGEGGNVGIAGHRDGIFRVLKNVGPGDVMYLETLDRVYLYKVDQIVIVDKNDLSVLQQSATPKLTLVTCYPFYFIGSAPKRYIVVASLVTTGVPAPEHATSSAQLEPASPTSEPQSQKPTKETPQ